jgi:hypothetical protein
LEFGAHQRFCLGNRVNTLKLDDGSAMLLPEKLDFRCLFGAASGDDHTAACLKDLRIIEHYFNSQRALESLGPRYPGNSNQKSVGTY